MSARSATSMMTPKGAAHRRLAGRLVIATHNLGKLKEMRELLMSYGIEAASAWRTWLLKSQYGLSLIHI